jgi:hypothetical protein
MYAFSWVCLCLCLRLLCLVSLLASLGCLLRLALALLHFEFSTLFAVARALVVQLVVLGCDLGLAGFAVTAAASTGIASV